MVLAVVICACALMRAACDASPDGAVDGPEGARVRLDTTAITKRAERLDLDPATPDADAPRLVWVKRIWDRAPWNGRGELIRFSGAWFCAFKEGLRHTNERQDELDRVGCRIITSTDTDTWTSVVKFQHDEVLFENATLRVAPDGRLMCLLCQDTPKGIEDLDAWSRKYSRIANWVSFSQDGRTWTEPLPIRYRNAAGEPVRLDREIFHLDCHGGAIYAIPRGCGLWRSGDGVNYTQVKRVSTEPRGARFADHETALRICPNGEMIALCRSHRPPGQIACSRPPYTHWTVRRIPHAAHGPNFVILPGGQMWAVSRETDEAGKPPYRTVLYKMTRTAYEPALALPSGGDTSYAGMAWHANFLWVSYYSSHESRTLGKEAVLYLAKVKLPDPASQR